MLRSLRASRSSSELEEEDRERLLRLGGVLLGGDCLGDLLLGDRRPRLGYLTLTECLRDLDLDGRELLPLLICGGEGVLRRAISCFFDCSSSAMRQFYSSVIDDCRLTVQSK